MHMENSIHTWEGGGGNN